MAFLSQLLRGDHNLLRRERKSKHTAELVSSWSLMGDVYEIADEGYLREAVSYSHPLLPLAPTEKSPPLLADPPGPESRTSPLWLDAMLQRPETLDSGEAFTV